MTGGPGTTTGRLDWLVSNTAGFFDSVWARRPRVLRAEGVAGLLTEEQIWHELDCGQLTLPYVTVFGGSSPGARMAPIRSRTVNGFEVDGFVDRGRLRREFDAGATLKFNRIDHWHLPVRKITDEMSEIFESGVVAHAFLSPPGDEPVITAHLDGLHVFILQTSGTKDWVAGAVDPVSPSGSAFCEHTAITEQGRLETRLTPGDGLYLPHGSPHYALARSETSLHIAIEVQDPTPWDFIEAYCARVEGTADWPSEVSRDQAATSGADRFREVFLAALDPVSHDDVKVAAARIAQTRTVYPAHRRT
ncbi:JmjC domain-containing protein [Streptosporangium amethystogenes]|uniref:JmjC domain-containing protein n=1 Tax=Streptosporangium amethystogenes TaxID=2002 RepID=UPI0004C82927|nr:cupin domain-containing protein [Streptosporangium amethystogenes]